MLFIAGLRLRELLYLAQTRHHPSSENPCEQTATALCTVIYCKIQGCEFALWFFVRIDRFLRVKESFPLLKE